MGATIQRTRYSEDSKRILTDESGIPKSTTSLKVISGLDILSNNQVRLLIVFGYMLLTVNLEVNLVSSIATAAVLGYLA